MSKKTEIKKIRCAIYTRKSTEERLDLEFNSLDSQRAAAEAFIASQKSEGWVGCDLVAAPEGLEFTVFPIALDR